MAKRISLCVILLSLALCAAPVAQPAQQTPPPANNALARFGQYEQLKRAFENAKQYDEAWKKAEKTKSSEAGVKRDAAKDFLRKNGLRLTAVLASAIQGQSLRLAIRNHLGEDAIDVLRDQIIDRLRLMIK